MTNNKFTVKLADTQAEIDSAMKLRLQMIAEYDPSKTDVKSDCSEWDKDAYHLIVKDNDTNEVVAYYRMITSKHCSEADKFVCEEEFDINSLKAGGEKLCEFSRAVVQKDYRNGTLLVLLWKFILDFVQKNNCRYLIGDVSFMGTNRETYREEISYLVNNFAIDEYDIKSKDTLPPMKLMNANDYDSAKVKRRLPALLKAYTAFGGKLSSETFVDTAFGSVDLFVLLDMNNVNWAYVHRMLG